MISITFSDPGEKRKALGFLVRRFPGRVLKTGEILVPELALQALAHEGFRFTVMGKATYEQQITAFRDTVTPTV